MPVRSTAPEARLGQDKLALAGTDALNQALSQTPVMRDDKVAQAKSLISDPSYPPPVLIRKISALLAIHLDPVAQPVSSGTSYDVS